MRKREFKLNIEKIGGKKCLSRLQNPFPSQFSVEVPLSLLFGASGITEGRRKFPVWTLLPWPPVTPRLGIGPGSSRNSSKENKASSSAFQTAELGPGFFTPCFSQEVAEAFSGAVSQPLSPDGAPGSLPCTTSLPSWSHCSGSAGAGGWVGSSLISRVTSLPSRSSPTTLKSSSKCWWEELLVELVMAVNNSWSCLLISLFF